MKDYPLNDERNFIAKGEKKGKKAMMATWSDSDEFK